MYNSFLNLFIIYLFEIADEPKMYFNLYSNSSLVFFSKIILFVLIIKTQDSGSLVSWSLYLKFFDFICLMLLAIKLISHIIDLISLL